jgi:hypothetical protein
MRQDVLMMFHPDNDCEGSSDFISGMQYAIEDVLNDLFKKYFVTRAEQPGNKTPVR